MNPGTFYNQLLSLQPHPSYPKAQLGMKSPGYQFIYDPRPLEDRSALLQDGWIVDTARLTDAQVIEVVKQASRDKGYDVKRLREKHMILDAYRALSYAKGMGLIDRFRLFVELGPYGDQHRWVELEVGGVVKKDYLSIFSNIVNIEGYTRSLRNETT